ncbi:unnamed protein product, partial [Linum tenue]
NNLLLPSLFDLAGNTSYYCSYPISDSASPSPYAFSPNAQQPARILSLSLSLLHCLTLVSNLRTALLMAWRRWWKITPVISARRSLRGFGHCTIITVRNTDMTTHLPVIAVERASRKPSSSNNTRKSRINSRATMSASAASGGAAAAVKIDGGASFLPRQQRSFKTMRKWKIIPSCGTMCVCCPALRSTFRQPVKRYKKLLADIFPKSPDAPPNERKTAKLCEYAAKNPIQIPKIAKYLEERCCKKLWSDHAKFISVIMEAYNKLLCICKEQMTYFAVNLLNKVNKLLVGPNQSALLIPGCQTLTKFFYSQVGGTYAHEIENYAPKVCKLALKHGEEGSPSSLRASSLQCLSAMVYTRCRRHSS